MKNVRKWKSSMKKKGRSSKRSEKKNRSQATYKRLRRYKLSWNDYETFFNVFLVKLQFSKLDLRTRSQQLYNYNCTRVHFLEPSKVFIILFLFLFYFKALSLFTLPNQHQPKKHQSMQPNYLESHCHPIIHCFPQRDFPKIRFSYNSE